MLLNNDTVEIDSIRVIYNSNGIQNANGLYNNNAKITNGSSASMKFRNTYKPASNKTSFEANKVWMDRKEHVVAAPEGATVAFTLFKEVGGVTTSTGRTIILDGVADNDGEINPWQAVFSDLPKQENGQTIRYKVKETTGWPDYYACKNKGKNLMRENEYLDSSGGTIYNRHLLATIQIQKHFDIQPNKYSDADWAEMLAKKQPAWN
ncbi:MAG: Cna B-type domain-containing protein [Clostridia bacterium]|nr:Cna B-type domain-containing protein [Clostridia bacterium]